MCGGREEFGVYVRTYLGVFKYISKLCKGVRELRLYIYIWMYIVIYGYVDIYRYNFGYVRVFFFTFFRRGRR